MTKFQEKVYTIVQKIPRGKVLMYAAVARMMKHPAAVRAVGNALNKNSSHDVPCHRVVRSDGSVGGFNRGTVNKIKLLKSEGVTINSGKVIGSNLLWTPNEM